MIKSKVKGVVKFLLNAAALGLVLQSPRGSRLVMRELSKHIFPEKKYRKFFREKEMILLSQTLYYLKQRKLIAIRKIGEKVVIELTEKGRKRKLAYDLKEMKIPIQNVWDKKWRLVVFDIPEKHKLGRRALREKLKQMGFLQFQKSVWIYPYPCENEIDFISEYFSLAKYVNVLTASIKEEREVREYFSL